MKYQPFCVIFLLLLVIVLPAQAGPSTVSVATLSGNPPWTFDQPGAPQILREIIAPGTNSRRLQGYSWDVLRESYHAMGYTIELHILPWARAFNTVRGGSVDILFPTGFNQERSAFFHYSEEPINHVEFLIYVNQGSQWDWQGLASLRGRVIGVLRGWNYGDEWARMDAIETYEINNIMQGFRMLHQGRIDGLAGYEQNFDFALAQYGAAMRFDKLPVFGGTFEYAVGSQSNPRAEELLRVFDSGKRRIEKNGLLKQLQQHWRATRP